LTVETISPSIRGMNPPVPVMRGGAKEHMLDLIKKYAQPLNIYIGIILVLCITYIGQIPKSVSFYANTLVGRFAFFWLTVIIADTYSWVYALLMALFVALLIAVSPRTLEGFQSSEKSDTDLKIVTQKKRWWSEEILQENPIGIEEEKVKTAAIQDNTNASNSTNSSK
jgi:hypothetical protein